MKTGIAFSLIGAFMLMARTGLGESPTIASFQGNGQLTWTNNANPAATYRVEWASQANGPWFQTFQSLHTIDAHNGTTFSASVPMFYRVVMLTNSSPEGMVLVDAGDVVLGADEDREEPVAPVHTNFVSAFYMDEMEVTKGLWDQVYQWAVTNGYQFDNPGSGKATNHPVQMISWYDCAKWCNARSEKAGLSPCYFTSEAWDTLYRTGRVDMGNGSVKWEAEGFRLPTEAEWEKAARGGRQQKRFSWGDDISHSLANYYSTNSFPYDISPTRGYHPAYNDGIEPYTSPVGSFPANGYGLHDMIGNVSEMCWDWEWVYSEDYQVDPHGPDPVIGRICRGGNWEDEAYFACVFDRDLTIWIFSLTSPRNTRGFRCVRTANSL